MKKLILLALLAALCSPIVACKSKPAPVPMPGGNSPGGGSDGTTE